MDDSGWHNRHRYPLSVRDRENFEAPDLVLIDARFRAACLVTALLRSRKEVTVLFGDYTGRREHHVVEEFVESVATVGRMASFRLVPGDFPRDRLTMIAGLFTRPF